MLDQLRDKYLSRFGKGDKKQETGKAGEKSSSQVKRGGKSSLSSTVMREMSSIYQPQEKKRLSRKTVSRLDRSQRQVVTRRIS